MLDLEIWTKLCVTVFNIGWIISIIPMENANIRLQTKHQADMFALVEVERGWKFSLVWH